MNPASPPSQSNAHRPRVVTAAVIVYAAVFIGVEAWSGWGSFEVFEPVWVYAVATGLMLTMSAIELGALWLAYRGGSWGRHALVGLHVLCLLGILTATVLSDDSDFGAAFGIDEVVLGISTLLQVACVALLYTRPAQPWFSRPKPAPDEFSEPKPVAG